MRLQYLGKYNRIYGLMVLPDGIDRITVEMLSDQMFINEAAQSIYVVDRTYIVNNINSISGIAYINNRVTKDYKLDPIIRKKLYQLFNMAVEDWLSSRTLDKHVLPGCELTENIYPREAQTLRKPIRHVENINTQRKQRKRKPRGKYDKQINRFMNGKNSQDGGAGRFKWKFKYTEPKKDA